MLAVLTYRRPELLELVVPALVEQAAQLSAATPISVLIVDNDPDAGAAETAAQWAGPSVTYVVEPRPGIAAARNRALDHARDLDADALIFIDDDEVPRPGWLAALVSAWLSWGCAAVAGPVVSVFEGRLDPWIEASGLFERKERPTGAVVGGAATNNLLLDLRVLHALGLRFDDEFALTGGEDTMLTHTLVQRGEQIRWCDEAEVTTLIPPRRTTRSYVMRRNFRTGTTWSRVALRLAQPHRRAAERADLIARGGIRVTKGCAQVARGWLLGSVAAQAVGASAIASGSGVLAGALGYRYVEYKRPVQAPSPESVPAMV